MKETAEMIINVFLSNHSWLISYAIFEISSMAIETLSSQFATPVGIWC